MRVMTVTELLGLTRKELCDLAARITASMPSHRDHPVEHANAHINLRNIRSIVARCFPSPS